MKARSIAVIAACSGIAHADDSIQQTLSYSWDASEGFMIGSFQGFDDAGGARSLTGVSFDVNGSLAMDVEALNFSDFALESGEWAAEGITNVNVLFGEFGPGSVEAIAGAIAFGGLTGELGAGLGTPFGPPGSPTVTQSYLGSLGGSFQVDDADFGVFMSNPVSVSLLSFSDFIISSGPPGSIISIATNSLTSEGSINLTYTYDVVPAPSALLSIGLGAAVCARRRR